MKSLLIVWITILTLANIFMFIVSLFFGNGKKDRASKFGFFFMEFLAVANIVTTGGLAVWAY